jgi:preprotein translocase subunit SecE
MAKPSPAEFVRQVRQEGAKVAFPSRKETLVSSAMVFVMVTVAALFLLLTDSIVQFVIRQILGFGQ